MSVATLHVHVFRKSIQSGLTIPKLQSSTLERQYLSHILQDITITDRE